MRISKVMLHRWEEPCISGSDKDRGSGAIFFSGCPLHCIYCQNRDISSGGAGKTYTPKELSEILRMLEDKGAYNINFVTPTHFTDKIIEALDIYKPNLPIVFNTSSYEKLETLDALSNYADIFLADLKYSSEEISKKYSKAPDYPTVALEAIKKMVEIVGKPQFESDRMMKKGVIVRLLVLPGQRKDAVLSLERLFEAVGSDDIVLSLMSQYTPEFAPHECKELCRRTTTFEYEFVRSRAVELGFAGFGQDRQSSTSAYTPDFSENKEI